MTQHTTRGSVLIFTVIISAILLSISVSLASILEKEVSRQIYADNAQVALNIANTAFECVLYNDFKNLAFGEGLKGETALPFVCGNAYQAREHEDWSEQYVPSSTASTTRGTGTYEFDIINIDWNTILRLETTADISDKSNIPCAHVVVKKTCVGGGTVLRGTQTVCSEGVESFVEVKGYALCSEGDDADRDLVQRFRVYY